MNNDEAFELITRHVSAAKARAFRDAGLRVVQGSRDGVRIRDLDGNTYINCRSSGGVYDFGHRPRFAIDALHAALDELGDMGDWLVPSLVRAEAAEALAGILPGDLRYTFFTPSGAEAVEVALKLARGVTGRPGIVGAEHGYHGHVGFSLALDEDDASHWFRPLVPGVTKVPFGDAAALDAAVTDQTAAVCMESIPATAGYLLPPDDFWPRARAVCDERGALLVMDEVQAGLGRTGRIWACEHWGVVPDILVAGKGLSGGVYPIAACSFNERVDAFFGQDPFFHPSSYSGSELGCRVVQAVVERVRDPSLLANVRARAEQIDAGLDELCREFPAVLAGHWGLGLMQALETHSGALTFDLMLQAIGHGVLAIWANNRQTVLQVMPPLVITAEEVDEVLAGLRKAVEQVHA
ncbi:MAG: aminotransferase class III-fold pyridoxal phosphate-dependent enzyme [Acidimicrobiia bacterium]